MLHITSQPGQAPDVLPANLLMSAPDEVPGGLVRALPDPDNPDLVERPVIEAVDLRAGLPAFCIARYSKGADPDSVMAALYVSWRAHEHADLTWSSPSYDISALLRIRNDLVDLARVTTLVPIDDQPPTQG